MNQQHKQKKSNYPFKHAYAQQWLAPYNHCSQQMNETELLINLTNIGRLNCEIKYATQYW